MSQREEYTARKCYWVREAALLEIFNRCLQDVHRSKGRVGESQEENASTTLKYVSRGFSKNLQRKQKEVLELKMVVTEVKKSSKGFKGILN